MQQPKTDMKCGELSAIVLAAGLSSRMGQNKLLMDFKGEPMLAAVLRLVLSCGFREIILVISRETQAGIGAPASFTVVINPKPERGQGSSVALGANAASPDSRGIMFFQADMPLLDKNTVLAIVSTFDGKRITVPEAEGSLRSPAIFPAAFRGELAALAGDEGGRKLLKKHNGLIQPVPFSDVVAFGDVDTITDYNKLRNV
jgi:molybdenum cofactor cytidylyltransferase